MKCPECKKRFNKIKKIEHNNILRPFYTGSNPQIYECKKCGCEWKVVAHHALRMDNHWSEWIIIKHGNYNGG